MAVNGIGWAVKELLAGARVTRQGWNGKGMWLERVPATPYASSSIMQEFIVMRTVSGAYVPWTCSQSDLLAVDWETS